MVLPVRLPHAEWQRVLDLYTNLRVMVQRDEEDLADEFDMVLSDGDTLRSFFFFSFCFFREDLPLSAAQERWTRPRPFRRRPRARSASTSRICRCRRAPAASSALHAGHSLPLIQVRFDLFSELLPLLLCVDAIAGSNLSMSPQTHKRSFKLKHSRTRSSPARGPASGSSS